MVFSQPLFQINRPINDPKTCPYKIRASRILPPTFQSPRRNAQIFCSLFRVIGYIYHRDFLGVGRHSNKGHNGLVQHSTCCRQVPSPPMGSYIHALHLSFIACFRVRLAAFLELEHAKQVFRYPSNVLVFFANSETDLTVLQRMQVFSDLEQSAMVFLSCR